MANVTITMSLGAQVAAATLTTCLCLFLLFINGVMLFTLRSKCVFRETSRYILLYNLLLADTLQLALSQLLYLLIIAGTTLTYPMCGILTMLNNLVTRISPLVLVLMSLERYVAVCHPLRHSSLITARNTGGVVLAAWMFCFLNVLIQGLLLIMFPFDQLESLQMTQFCKYLNLFFVPVFVYYYTVSTYFVFILASLSIIFSYVGVALSARSAATNRDSACKALNTLLLHLVQLGLSLFSVLYISIMSLISSVFSPLILIRLQAILFVCVFLLPRSLSSLVYGLKDKSLRVVLVYHLCCHLKVSVVTVKTAPGF